ncbi:MAG TPA: hypothetical protein VJY62_13565, partial [Bacteroidia bacterium]|nr:hypothetical protein [Bacteroidia bacterium]
RLFIFYYFIRQIPEIRKTCYVLKQESFPGQICNADGCIIIRNPKNKPALQNISSPTLRERKTFLSE